MRYAGPVRYRGCAPRVPGDVALAAGEDQPPTVLTKALLATTPNATPAPYTPTIDGEALFKDAQSFDLQKEVSKPKKVVAVKKAVKLPASAKAATPALAVDEDASTKLLAADVLAKDGEPAAPAADVSAASLELSAEKRVVTWQELAEHASEESLWVAISGKVYDITSWQATHPGGQLTLLAVAGGDATDTFRAMHPKQVWSQLGQFLIGNLESALPPATLTPELGTSTRPSPFMTEAEKATLLDFRALQRWAQQEGLLEPKPLATLRRGAILASILAMVVCAVVFSQSVALHMAAAVVLGLWWQQMGFMGHDSGHNGITGVGKIDGVMGYLCGNICSGISMGWWKSSHNVHHIVVNSINYDPDVQHVPVFAFGEAFFKSPYSLYHFRQMTFDAVAQFLVSYQHLTFYPIVVGVGRLNLYLQSILHIVVSRHAKNRLLEVSTLLLFWAWFGTLLFQLPTLWEKVAFFAICHVTSGILHVQIIINHFANPMYEGRATSALWAQMQVLSSLNISCSPAMDWFYGGLQFQIEHHLFPRAPRGSLRPLSVVVKAFCEKHNIPYEALSFWDANVKVLDVLYQNALLARQLNRKVAGSAQVGEPGVAFHSMLKDALDARG